MRSHERPETAPSVTHPPSGRGALTSGRRWAGPLRPWPTRRPPRPLPRWPPVPVEVSIKALGVNAPVLPVGIAQAGGNMQIPQDVRVIGWYRFGPSPGQLGSAILVGHVDSRAQGPGAFFRLAHLRVGASIIVRSQDGSSLRFGVVARRSYPKGGLPAWIFDRTGPPTLALVTCGGSFDRRLRRYADNIVIFAVPV